MFKKTTLLAMVVGATFAFNTNAAEEEKKSYGEWVDIIKREYQAGLKANPGLESIEKGAALYQKISMDAWFFRPETTHKKEMLTTIGKGYLKAFMDFKNSSKGKSLFEKYKKDGVLEPKDQPYFLMIKALVDPYPYHKGHGDKKLLGRIVKSLTKFAEKAYKHEPVTRHEMDKFREFLAVCPKGGTSAHWPAKDFAWSKELSEIYKSPISIQGKKVPDYKFHYYETLAKQRGYTNHANYKFSLHAYFTPIVLEYIKRPLDSYKYEIKNGKPEITPDNSDFDNLKKDEYFSVHEQVKKGRPFYFMEHNITDSTDYVRRVGYQEALYWLFKDDVDFFHVSRLDFDFGICEYFNKIDVFTGLYKNKSIKAGHTNPENFYNPKTGAIPEIPKSFLRLPTKSVPILINLGGRIKEHKWGIPHSFIDKNGIECQYEKQKGKGINNPHNIGHEIQFSKKMRKGDIKFPGSKFDNYSLMKNIRFFKIMETLNWEYDPNSELLQSHYRDLKDTDYREFAVFLIKNATVKKVDMNKKELHIFGKLTEKKKAVKEDVIIHFGDHPFIASTQTKISDLKEGDIITIKYKLKVQDEPYRILKGASIQGDRSVGFGELGHTEGIFISGKVTAVDLNNYTCTLIMPKPDPAKGEWKGFEMYEKELKPLGMEPITDEISKGWSFCKKLYYGTEADRTFILKLDDCIDLSVNGRFSSLDKVSVGDKIIFSISTTRPRKTDKHPYYSPYNIHVVKPGPLTGDELIFKPNQ